MSLDEQAVRESVRVALAEDLGAAGDVTTRVSLPRGLRGEAVLFAKQGGVLAGMQAVYECFRQTDPEVEFDPRDLVDGAELQPGQTVARLAGDAAGLLAAERTALNFLQHLSGIATRTREYVAEVDGFAVKIMDTRKTTPGLRLLEKHAVAVGGGVNHRIGLFDCLFLKENHFAMAGRPFDEVVRGAVASAMGPVVAEAQTVEEGLLAVAGGASVVLLDNLTAGPALSDAVDALRERSAELGVVVEIEASGGVTLENVRAIAACGVDRISIGALTHSAAALDLSMLTKCTS